MKKLSLIGRDEESLSVSQAQTLILDILTLGLSILFASQTSRIIIKYFYTEIFEKIKRKFPAAFSITARQAVLDGERLGWNDDDNSDSSWFDPFPMFIVKRSIFMASLQIAEQIRLIQTLLQLVDVEMKRKLRKKRSASQVEQPKRLVRRKLFMADEKCVTTLH